MASNNPPEISTREALNVLPNTATVNDTAALDEFQRVETERSVRPPPKKGLGEHVSDEANWKKVALGAAGVALVVAVAFGLKKAADNGDLDHLDQTAKRKAKEAKRAAQDAAGAVSHKAKETSSWASDKTRDVVDSVASGTALQDAGHKVQEAGHATKEAAIDFKENAQAKMEKAKAEADQKAREAQAELEKRRMADKAATEDNGFLGHKKWFK